MSSITFDSRMFNPELAVSRSEHSGNGRKQQQARADLVETLPRISKPDEPQAGEPPKPEAAPALFNSTAGRALDPTGASGEYVQESGKPQPDPLVMVEIRLFEEGTPQPETESQGQARLNIRI